MIDFKKRLRETTEQIIASEELDESLLVEKMSANPFTLFGLLGKSSDEPSAKLPKTEKVRDAKSRKDFVSSMYVQADNLADQLKQIYNHQSYYSFSKFNAQEADSLYRDLLNVRNDLELFVNVAAANLQLLYKQLSKYSPRIKNATEQKKATRRPRI